MKRRPMFMFGMRCVRCDHEIIAPRETELLDDRVIRHLWHCPGCKARFESFPRFPKGAKLVKDVMKRYVNVPSVLRSFVCRNGGSAAECPRSKAIFDYGARFCSHSVSHLLSREPKRKNSVRRI